MKILKQDVDAAVIACTPLYRNWGSAKCLIAQTALRELGSLKYVGLNTIFTFKSDIELPDKVIAFREWFDNLTSVEDDAELEMNIWLMKQCLPISF